MKGNSLDTLENPTQSAGHHWTRPSLDTAITAHGHHWIPFNWLEIEETLPPPQQFKLKVFKVHYISYQAS